MNEYQKFLVKMLGTKINSILEKAGKDKINDSDPVEVMSNMDKLYKEVDVLEFGAPTGEKYRFMTKEDKVMLLRVISLTASIVTTCNWDLIKDESGNEVSVVRASASLFFDRNDSKPVAFYQKLWLADKLLGTNYKAATLEEKSSAENLARGLCETRCLSKFGIGQWFGEEDPEEDLAKLSNASGEIAELAIPEQNAAPTSPLTDSIDVSVSGDKDEIPFEDSTTAQQLTITFPAPTNEQIRPQEAKEEIKPKKTRVKKAVESATQETAAETETAVATINMTIEEAKQVKATIGLAASNGYTLGYLAENERMKRTNLRYIYTHSNNAREKEAIRILALNDPEIKASFDGEGISLV